MQLQVCVVVNGVRIAEIRVRDNHKEFQSNVSIVHVMDLKDNGRGLIMSK